MSLKLSKLSKRFGNKWIFRDLTLEARNGEVLGLFGPSGSGKSVFLDIIAGRDLSASGTIYRNDIDVTKLRSAERGFSYPKASNKSTWSSLFGKNKGSQFFNGHE